MIIYLLEPRGFCAGVKRAIDIVELALSIYGAPLYVRHQIVHNNNVVQSLKEKGVIFVEDIKEVPKGSRLILSAHGSSPTIKEAAKKQELIILDATCPLVTKVHLEAKKYHNEGYSIILIGHHGHQEVIGTTGIAPMNLIEKISDIENLHFEDENKIAYITQTTLSIDDTAEIVAALKKRYPKIITSPLGDICYATQNRQNTVKKFASICDLILVLGAKHSSNSNRLRETALKQGVKAYLIENSSHIDSKWFQNAQSIGITSGASVPENLVEDVITELTKYFPFSKVVKATHIRENISFAIPTELQVSQKE